MYQAGFSTIVTGRIGGAGEGPSNALWTPFAENGARDTILNNLHGGYSDINPSACTNLNGGRNIINSSVAKYAISESREHHTNVPLAAVGGDVCWITAPKEYRPYDLSIAHTNSNKNLGVHAHYSSISKWAAALYASNKTVKIMPTSDEVC